MQQLRWFMLLLCLIVVTVSLAADSPTAKPPVTPTKAPKVVEKINPKDGAAMVWVPAGKFIMGSTDAQLVALCKGSLMLKNWCSNEKPKHTVKLDGYWMYKNDVTVAQYKKFCAATTREMPDAPELGWIDEHPMVNLSWDDANAYAQWAGAALPTEAQWEKAARGTDGRIYPWGNEWDAEKCNNAVSGYNTMKTTAVGSYPASVSPYGCLDMVGNVYQWCADWYDENYKNSPKQNPTGSANGTTRVLRGGCWYDVDTRYFRAAYRDSGEPTIGFVSIGFRCAVRSPGP